MFVLVRNVVRVKKVRPLFRGGKLERLLTIDADGWDTLKDPQKFTRNETVKQVTPY